MTEINGNIRDFLLTNVFELPFSHKINYSLYKIGIKNYKSFITFDLEKLEDARLLTEEEKEEVKIFINEIKDTILDYLVKELEQEKPKLVKQK